MPGQPTGEVTLTNVTGFSTQLLGSGSPGTLAASTAGYHIRTGLPPNICGAWGRTTTRGLSSIPSLPTLCSILHHEKPVCVWTLQPQMQAHYIAAPTPQTLTLDCPVRPCTPARKKLRIFVGGGSLFILECDLEGAVNTCFSQVWDTVFS